MVLSCRIFVHFATKPDPVTEFIKLRSTLIFKHFATKLDTVTEFIKLGSALSSKAPLIMIVDLSFMNSVTGSGL